MSSESKIMCELRAEIIRAAHQAGEGHIPSSFSILDLLWVLYDRVLKVNPANPQWVDRDYFYLSKGHAALGLYAVLAEKDFFSKTHLFSLGKFESILGGHPDCRKVPGVEASTGSLGHGFPMAVGAALGLKIQKKLNRVFTIIGDGECNEGSVWESALLAAHHRLGNLVCIVDYNHSTDRALGMGDLVAKFHAFGWEALSISGHDHELIFNSLQLTNSVPEKPRALIAETIKGYGCKEMENQPSWHHKAPNEEELQRLLRSLNA